MTWRTVTVAVLAACVVWLANCPAAEDKPVKETPGKDTAGAPVQYLPLDAPAGMSQAAIVQGQPLVHTRQLLPLDREGKPVGEGSVDKQIEQVLDNLDAVLGASGSGLGKLVRLNVYAITPQTVDRVRELLSKRLDASVRPVMTAVLTPMPHRKALVAVDAIAVSSEKGQTVALKRCEAVAGDKDLADAAVLPPGGVAYLSGVPEESDVAVPAVTKSMSTLWRTLGQLKISAAQVVQLKVFLRPALAADEVSRRLKEFFPGQMTPPVVFVEWSAAPQAEIELIAQLPPADKPAQDLEYYNPPDTRPLPIFSRVALVRSQRQIYLAGLFAREAGNGEAQAGDVFAQLKTILDQTGSDLRHLVKASYYVCDPDAGRGYDIARPKVLDPKRPPAASLIMVHGVGKSGRTLTMDMIAVESGK
jgi:enamine deaminase RidA (YjgF/YER057c/UK114 family)